VQQLPYADGAAAGRRSAALWRFSKSGEFVHDRPFLWGSRRTGPDLARIGGKYPDAWHSQHMAVPKSMVPLSNMPAYAFLNELAIDPEYTRKKMQVLDFPFDEEQIRALAGKTEMDAMVAYLQKLGSDIPWRQAARTEIVGDLSNPYQGDSSVIPEGETLYREHCAACHGADLTGGIGPGLEDLDMADTDLYQILYNGIPEGGMPAFAALGSDRVWKMVNFLIYTRRVADGLGFPGLSGRHHRAFRGLCADRYPYVQQQAEKADGRPQASHAG
jgi:cytochrome c oxidase cbb3-type subunit II